jgi:hypothetical protein
MGRMPMPLEGKLWAWMRVCCDVRGVGRLLRVGLGVGITGVSC